MAAKDTRQNEAESEDSRAEDVLRELSSYNTSMSEPILINYVCKKISADVTNNVRALTMSTGALSLHRKNPAVW